MKIKVTTPASRRPLPVRGAMGVLLVGLLPAATLRAQQSASAISPAVLARYDTNRNGVIDPAEQSKMDADTVRSRDAAAAMSGDSVVELSPFVIQASAETGWVASQTLAGSRMKTDFKDLAQPIEVMTMEFMQDMGANNFEDALNYATNIEGPNDRTGIDRGGFGAGQPKNNNIFRGLNSGTTAHDFFQSDLPSDNYNTERLTIARGPNAILFGLGSPAGIVDATLKRGNLRKNSAELQLQITSDESKRAAFDLNRVIVPDRLALRLDTMTDEGLRHLKPNLDRQTRWYGAVTAKPFKTTSLTVAYEDAYWNSNRPKTMLNHDGYSTWLGAGQYFPSIYSADQPIFDNRMTGAANAGNFTVANLTNNPVFARGGNPAVMLFNAGALEGNTQSWNNSVSVREWQNVPDAFNPFNSFDRLSFSARQNNPVPFDTNIEGTSSVLFMKTKTLSVFFEQQIAKNLFFEAAWNHQRYTERSASAGFGTDTIQVDANKYLPDGVTLNPNASRYYVQGRATGTEFDNQRDDYRATLSYELDLSKKAGWLGKYLFGRHRWAGLVTQDNYQRQGEQYQRGILEAPAIPGIMYRSATNVTVPTGLAALPQGSVGQVTGTGIRNWATDATRDFTTRFYLGGPGGNATTNPFGNLLDTWTCKDTAGNPYGAYMFHTPFTNAQGVELTRSGSGPEGTKTRTDSLALAWQDYLIDNRLVLLFGWRRDQGKSATLDPQYQVRDYSGLYPTWRASAFLPWNPSQIGTTRTYGAVVHVTKWASLIYNRSSTFQLNIGKYDPLGGEYPGATGEATDYGVAVRLLDEKLSVRLTHFENTSGPTRGGNSGYNDPTRDNLWNIENQMRLLDPSLNTLNLSSGGYREKGRANYWVMLDSQSKGYELDLSWQPSRNWSFIFNAAKNQSVQTNIGTEWFAWMNARLPVWQALKVPEGGKDNPRDVNGDGVVGTWTWANAPYNGNNNAKTFQQYYEQDVTSAMAWLQAVDGLALDQAREKRANLVAQYRFTEGRLKGLSTNVAFRYRGAPTLGYGTYYLPGTTTLTYDVTKSYQGLETINTDLGLIYSGRISAFKGFAESMNGLRYRAQLNVRNALNEWTLVPVKALTTGQYIRYNRTNPRTFIATFTFEY